MKHAASRPADGASARLRPRHDARQRPSRRWARLSSFHSRHLPSNCGGKTRRASLSRAHLRHAAISLIASPPRSLACPPGADARPRPLSATVSTNTCVQIKEMPCARDVLQQALMGVLGARRPRVARQVAAPLCHGRDHLCHGRDHRPPSDLIAAARTGAAPAGARSGHQCRRLLDPPLRPVPAAGPADPNGRRGWAQHATPGTSPRVELAAALRPVAAGLPPRPT